MYVSNVLMHLITYCKDNFVKRNLVRGKVQKGNVSHQVLTRLDHGRPYTLGGVDGAWAGGEVWGSGGGVTVVGT